MNPVPKPNPVGAEVVVALPNPKPVGAVVVVAPPNPKPVCPKPTRN